MSFALKLAFEIIANAGHAMSASDVRARLPIPCENARRLTLELRATGKIAEAFTLRNERFFVPVPGATPPEAPMDGRVSNSTEKALAVRRKHKLAMLAREARRRG